MDVRTQHPVQHQASGHGAHGARPAGPVPGGLQVSQGGYTLVPDSAFPDPRSEFRFRIAGPDGAVVTDLVPAHGRKVHFIVVSRDLSSFQHLHPREVGDGGWSVPLVLPKAGAYRAFTDIAPGGQPMTLGVDLFVPGDYRPAPPPEPTWLAGVDGYTVALDGELVPGKPSRLRLSVYRDGVPVTDLDPYLGAYGHLVALRAGDLAYLHVHPDGEPGDGVTAPGPDVTFYATAPSTGTYRLFLDFQHGGTVRTASFTLHA